MNGEQRPGWYFVYVQGDLNLHILRMFEGIFSLDGIKIKKKSFFFLFFQGDLFTGALFIQQSLRWDLYLCIFVLVIITGVLTMAGIKIVS